MSQSVVNEALGLRTFKNELTLPTGSLITANNVVIDRDNIIEPRRGIKLYQEFGNILDRAKQIIQYKNKIIVHYDDKLVYDYQNTFKEFSGSYNELIQDLRIKYLEFNGNLYFTSASGIKKISAKSNTDFTEDPGFITDAGAVKALDSQGVANTTIPGFLNKQSAVAYRILWGYRDFNNVLILGSPSEYFTVRNFSTTNIAVVDLVFTIPEEIKNDTKWFYQIYRSAQVSDSLDPGTALPEDELNLVYEDFPTDTDFTNGFVTTQDITPDDFRNGGAALYTNPISGQGILQANERPPLATDITTYKGYTFYSNTKTRHQKELSVISTSLLKNGDKLIIKKRTTEAEYTFKVGQYIFAPIQSDWNSSSDDLNVNVDIDTIQITKTANDLNGEYIYPITFKILEEDLDKKLSLILDIDSTDINYVDDDLIIKLYDKDNDVYLTESFLIKNGTFTDQLVEFTASATGLEYEIHFIVNNTNLNTYTIDIENVIVIAEDSGENVSNNRVFLANGGTPSQNIDDTTRSLIRVINRSESPVYAYYLSGPEDVPGQMLLEERIIDVDIFNVKVSTGTNSNAFNPRLPTDDSEVSSNQSIPNRIYFSKLNQPESVPISNFFDVGEQDKPIERILGLRDSLFIIKGDGIFRLSGNNSINFTVTLSDSSALILAPDTAAILNNQIFMASNQGIVSIPESGVPTVISRDIEDLIIKPSTLPQYSKLSFGVGYESERSYLLFVPARPTDDYATQCYRFNIFTRAWTKYIIDKPKTCGLVLKANDKLYLGAGDINYVEEERKNFDRTDYAERESLNSIPQESIDGNVIRISNISGVNVADTIFQETYITISRFNRLLRKLDNDFNLDDTDYYDTLKIETGGSMNNQLSLLVTKIQVDDPEQTYTIPSGSNNFTTIKNEYNKLVQELNESAGTFYKNYKQFNDLVSYEAIITNVNKFNNSIVITNETPFIQGEVKIFESLISSVEWSPNTLGDPSVMKHFREATLMFEQYNFTIGTMEFRTDISESYEGIDFRAEGNGSYGSQVYGEYVYGGLANKRPFRTYIPRNKQRCRFVFVKFTHKGSREKYSLNGYSLTFKQYTTERAYKG